MIKNLGNNNFLLEKYDPFIIEGIEKMENKYVLSNSMSMSSEINHLAQAMLECKSKFNPAKKTATNDFKKYKYAKIEDLLNAVEEILELNKIWLVHYARPIDDGTEYLFTRLIHSPSGQWIEDMRKLISEIPGNQGMGAATTYMRKCAILSLCGIPTEDDDAQGEQNHIGKMGVTNNKPQYSSKEYTISEIITLLNMSSNKGLLESNIKKFNNVTRIEDIPLDKYSMVYNYINKNKA